MLDKKKAIKMANDILSGNNVMQNYVTLYNMITKNLKIMMRVKLGQRNYVTDDIPFENVIERFKAAYSPLLYEINNLENMLKQQQSEIGAKKFASKIEDILSTYDTILGFEYC